MIQFGGTDSNYDKNVLERALFLAFLIVGVSYYKCFPVTKVRIEKGELDEWQADFMDHIYQEGLSQFAFENNLNRNQLAHFEATSEVRGNALRYDDRGKLVLQSGGKDSLLVACLLDEKREVYHPWYCSSSTTHPIVLDHLPHQTITARRILDHEQLKIAAQRGAKNGHIPVTYVISALAVIQAILLRDNEVVLGIAREGEEPHAWIGDLPVNHQWSKTAEAGELFQQYIERYVSADIRVYSPLRKYSELRVAEFFVQLGWRRFGHDFSSCNVANYTQGVDNQQLSWCGKCPKCANSYLLFAPFIVASELQQLFGGKDLFADRQLSQIFKGLLDIDGVMKPFECVGEVAELRAAYHMAQIRGGYAAMSFTVPSSTFNYTLEREAVNSSKIR